MRVIYIPAIERAVTIKAYVNAIRMAKQNPDREFKYGLTTWTPCTGKEIMKQFRRGMHERISDGIPYNMRGIK